MCIHSIRRRKNVQVRVYSGLEFTGDKFASLRNYLAGIVNVSKENL